MLSAQSQPSCLCLSQLNSFDLLTTINSMTLYDSNIISKKQIIFPILMG